MNMLVCIKQVPDTAEIKMDDVTNAPIMAGVPDIVNPYDEYALETANRIKDADPTARIIGVTVGSEASKAALKTCLAVGVDQAYLVSDPAFDGSDSLAVSYILKKAIETIEKTEGPFDIIFCGQQAIDGDSAQVGPQLAEQLGYPQVTYAIEATVEGGVVKVKREAEDGFDVTTAKLPCVVAMTQPFYDLRYPSIKSKMAANRANIPTLSAADIGAEGAQVGVAGSPTRIRETFSPPRRKGGMVISEGGAEADTLKLASLLRAASLI